VPLAEKTLELLRTYWLQTRPSYWLFPGRGHQEPISVGSLQKAFKKALLSSPVQKDASVHTLRHSYATHLLENGNELPVIQAVLGHSCSKTTTIYTHLTEKIRGNLNQSINQIMNGL
jgi:integrase/recombinase XerD